VLSGRGLCGELITHLEESYRLWYAFVCDLETSFMRRPWPTGAVAAKTNQKTGRYQYTTKVQVVIIELEASLLTSSSSWC